MTDPTPTTPAAPPRTIRQRVRVRFRKQADLRLISHRDLVRTWERLFRRAGLRLSLSEGFHPKARMSFPSALGLGIAGLDEVMEFELAEYVPAEPLRQRLAAQAPAGLAITDLQLLAPGQRKAQIRRTAYQLPIPEARRASLAAEVQRLQTEPARWVTRDQRQAPFDLKALLESLAYREGVLTFRLQADGQVGVRPREVLAALGVADLEQSGFDLTRTAVELTPGSNLNSSVEENPDHEEGNADQCVPAGRMPDRDH
jgi:radical SAM-linked protein